jgi:hypothetical protein
MGDTCEGSDGDPPHAIEKTTSKPIESLAKGGKYSRTRLARGFYFDSNPFRPIGTKRCLTDMRLRSAAAFIVGTVTVALVQSSRAGTQLDPVTDPDAYAIYAVLVPQAWARVSKDTLLLQRETEAPPSRCGSSGPASDHEWVAIENNFDQENTRIRLLQAMLPIDISYRLIPGAEIQADDARLALKYPGIWQRRPESMEYAAVSAVGFNPTKTKAMVYVRLRSSGNVHAMEIREGRWVGAQRPGCGWIE